MNMEAGGLHKGKYAGCRGTERLPTLRRLKDSTLRKLPLFKAKGYPGRQIKLTWVSFFVGEKYVWLTDADKRNRQMDLSGGINP